MNKIAEHRDGFRKKCRQEQLNKIKSNLRNLLIYCPEQSGEIYQCSLCQDDRWLYGKQNITIFHNSRICESHSDIFMSKILEYIILNPSLFGELIKCDKTETIPLVLHKIIVLHQIFGNDSIINNPGVKQYIIYNFQNRNEFIVKLMDCAYFNEEFIISQQTEAFYNLNRICFSCLYTIITKDLSLFLSYFDQYPFDNLIINSKDQKLTNMIRFIGEIISDNIQVINLKNIVYNSFKNHLRNVKGNSSNYQIFQSYIELIELILNKLNNIDDQMINIIVQKIINQQKMINSLLTNIINIFQIISYKYIHHLTQQNKYNFKRILKHYNLSHYDYHPKMQAQTDKISMQIQ